MVLTKSELRFWPNPTTFNPNRSGLTIREYHILKYAEYLHSDPALWRITVDYMCACGDLGKERADQVLIRVPLRLGSGTRNDGVSKSMVLEGNGDQTLDAEDEATRIRAGDVVGVLKDVNQCCFEYQREEVRRMVCRV
jgi:nuclear pore complex protein Nup85